MGAANKLSNLKLWAANVTVTVLIPMRAHKVKLKLQLFCEKI